MFRGSLLSAMPATNLDTWRIGVTSLSKTALIVDDSRSARFVLKRVLETHELDVDTAESAEDALDYLTEHRPDVIFMDHLMPGMDGFEAVSAIKRDPDTATIPIMMYTSQKGEVYVGQARALGAVGVLPKEVAPVEVSKVLESLHIIGGEERQQPAEQTPPSHDTGDEVAKVDSLDQDLRILIQDLFEQQQSIIRRDLRDNYETIARRITAAIPPPPADESNELPLPDERKSSGLIRGALLLLAFCTVVFAWLYWQSEQSLHEIQVQNTELRQTFESQRISAAEELQRALESQRIADDKDSQQVNQQISDFQQSLNAINAVTVNGLEWGANQASSYPFGNLPLGDERLEIVEQLTDYLLAIDFSGVVRIETHVANYCLRVAGADGYAPAKDRMVADCDQVGMSPAEAYEMGLRQSVAFANFVRLAEERSDGRIRYEIVSLGNSDPLIDYPATTDGVSASAWNRIAAANNRVVISVVPNAN